MGILPPFSQPVRNAPVNLSVLGVNCLATWIQSESQPKTLTKIEFPGQYDDNNRNTKDSMTIASWGISDGTFLNLGC